MKTKYLFYLLSIVFVINSCIGEDVINDFVEPELRILNPVASIATAETYQMDISFFNAIGQQEEAAINWTSTNEAIATISSSGLLLGIAEGTTTIIASVNLDNGTVLEESLAITITQNTTVFDPIVKSGTIVTTSSYILSGTFTLAEQENSNDLLLSVNGDYVADTALPGLYLYLTNNPSSVANALNLGSVSVFNGAHQYTIPETGINDFSHLLYWCEPFSVKVGDAEIVD